MAVEGEQELDDFLNFLSAKERRSFQAWNEANVSELGSAYVLAGLPVEVLTISNWKLGIRPDDVTLTNDQIKGVGAALERRRDGDIDHMFLCSDVLAVFHDALTDRSTGRVAIVTTKNIQAFVCENFLGVKITNAQQRVLMCLLAGMSLTESAELDDRSIETRKQQAQQLRHKFNVERTDDLVRIIGAQLTKSVSIMLGGQSALNNEHFNEYCRKFLPREARQTVLISDVGQPIRVVDLGPKDGRPMIALHPIILPDIRTKDVETLDELGIRLLWPLRNGQLGPNDQTLLEDEQIEQALWGIKSIFNTFLVKPATLLCFAASSKVAIRYAKRHPETVSTMCFLGSCVLEGRPESGPRLLARGLMSMLSSRPMLANAAMAFFRERVMNRRNYIKFLRRQFEASKADSLIVGRELAEPNLGERLRFALLSSIPSIRHDFNFQRALEWGRLDANKHRVFFFHGDDDAIHPISLIEGLVSKHPNARLRTVTDAGQLLHHEHLQGILAQLKDELDANS